jgi:hypothetical protein
VGSRMVVDPRAYDAASVTLGQTIGDRLAVELLRLGDALGNCFAMAGADDAGARWAGAYDDAARVVVAAGADVVNGCYRLAGLLEQTGFNYGMAELASTPGPVRWGAPDRTNYAERSAWLQCLVSAAGGTGSEPAGWALIKHWVGHVWPGGDQGRLRGAGAAWASAARVADEVSSYVGEAVGALELLVTPEVDDAVTACTAMGRHLQELAVALDAMANSCTGYAQRLADAHAAVVNELTDLLAWTAGIQAGGAVLAVFSFGVSEAAAQSAQSGRIATTAVRVAAIIETLISEVAVAVDTIANTAARVVHLSRDLEPLLATRVVAATTDTVEALPAATTAEAIAVNGLTKAEEASARVDRVLSRLRPGRRAPHLEVDGPHDVANVWAELSVGGRPIASRYPGEQVVLGDGTEVGYRTASKSGGPTVDIVRPDGTRIKVHVS